MAVDGITTDKTSYVRGETITVTFTDSSRAGVPEKSEPVTLTGTAGSGLVVTGPEIILVTPAVPAKAPGPVTDTGGHLYAIVAGSDSGTVAKFTAVA